MLSPGLPAFDVPSTLDYPLLAPSHLVTEHLDVWWLAIRSRRASSIEVTFAAITPTETRVALEHRDFERHGTGAEEYRNGLASSDGWPLILERYRSASSIHDTPSVRSPIGVSARNSTG